MSHHRSGPILGGTDSELERLRQKVHNPSPQVQLRKTPSPHVMQRKDMGEDDGWAAELQALRRKVNPVQQRRAAITPIRPHVILERKLSASSQQPHPPQPLPPENDSLEVPAAKSLTLLRGRTRSDEMLNYGAIQGQGFEEPRILRTKEFARSTSFEDEPTGILRNKFTLTSNGTPEITPKKPGQKPQGILKSSSLRLGIKARDKLMDSDSDSSESEEVPRNPVRSRMRQSNPLDYASVASTMPLNDRSQSCTDLGKNKKKSGGVKFGSVRIRTHLCRLGDNPSVSSGLPVELDWDHVGSETFDLDSFEDMGGGQPKEVKRLTRDERKEMLKKRGHTRQSFLRVSDDIGAIRQSRRKTRAIDEDDDEGDDEDVSTEEDKRRAKLAEFQRLMSHQSERAARRQKNNNSSDEESSEMLVSKAQSDSRFSVPSAGDISPTMPTKGRGHRMPRRGSPPPPPPPSDDDDDDDDDAPPRLFGFKFAGNPSKRVRDKGKKTGSEAPPTKAGSGPQYITI